MLNTNQSFQIYPYFFPTKVILLDDQESFLQSCSLLLDENICYDLHSSPKKVVELVHKENKNRDLFYKKYLHNEEGEFVYTFETLKQIINSEDRFKIVSVIVMDHDMPEMNGFEVCEKIDPSIRKILLTGVADEKQAIEAFNEGLIHGFISKKDLDIKRKLNEQIKKLQTSYFKKTLNLYLEMVPLEEKIFFENLNITELFQSILEKNEIIEYYFIKEKKGFLLISKEGKQLFLKILHQQNIRAHLEIADDENAPKELLQYLESNQWIPYFPTPDGFYNSEIKDWKSHLFPSQQINHEKELYYHILESNKEFLPLPIRPYQNYLQKLDTLL